MQNANSMNNNEETEIDLLELLFQYLKHVKWILLITIITGGAAFAISYFLITPVYESTSELYVLSKSTSITSLADLQMGTNLTNDYMVVVEGRPVLEQVIKTLGLEMDYEMLARKVTLNNPTNSRILQISVRDKDKELAKKIADEIAEVSSNFIAEKMDQDPPTIIQRGYSDGKPVSPSIMKNTVIGALLGMFLSMAVITVLYLLNDTIMTSEDVEKKLGLHVLGMLPLEGTCLEGDGEQKVGKKKRGRKTA